MSYSGKGFILTTVDDRLLVLASPADPAVNPDVEDRWFCDGCGMGYPSPPGGIVSEGLYYVTAAGVCSKCGSDRFSRSNLGSR